MKKSIVFQVWDSDLGKDDPQGEVQCAQSSLFGWSEMHHIPYLVEGAKFILYNHFGWSEMHQVVAKLDTYFDDAGASASLESSWDPRRVFRDEGPSPYHR